MSKSRRLRRTPLVVRIRHLGVVLRLEGRLPLHPEYRTLPMVWYVPPLSPISAAANSGAIGANGFIPDVAFLWLPQWGLVVALDVVLFIMAVMGGRVIPSFTNNAIFGALGAVLLLFACDLLGLELAAGVVALVAAMLQVGPLEVLAYALVMQAAAVRALLPIAFSDAYRLLVGVSDALWSMAFAL